MYYFWWGRRGNLTLITLRSERVNKTLGWTNHNPQNNRAATHKEPIRKGVSKSCYPTTSMFHDNGLFSKLILLLSFSLQRCLSVPKNIHSTNGSSRLHTPTISAHSPWCLGYSFSASSSCTIVKKPSRSQTSFFQFANALLVRLPLVLC